MFDTYVGTMDGVYRLTDSTLQPLGLSPERVWAIHAWHDGASVAILAGTYGNGMYRSPDAGRTWSGANDGMSASAFRCIGPDPLDPEAILAGTEPARIFRSRDGGRTWRELAGITRIAGHDTWYLPYSPRAGAVRNVFAPPGSTGRYFASVEVGGLLRTEDGGETWTCEPVLEDEDIHFITGDRSDPSLLYAALGYATLSHRGETSVERRFGGIARSRDGGATWRKLETDYTRAVLVPPSHPDLLVAAPAPRVSQGGRIVVSSDGGDSWEPASQAIETPMPDMVEVFVAAPDASVWAICSGGRLLRAEPDEWQWRSALPDASDIRVQSISFVEAGT